MNRVARFLQPKAWRPQPFTAISATLLALAGWLLSWGLLPYTPSAFGGVETSLAAIFLVAALVWTGIHPIHIQRQTKIYLSTLPLYLMAVLLPPPLAVIVASLGLLLTQLKMRSHTGNRPSDIATAISRWAIIVGLASQNAHLLATTPLQQAIQLCSTAAIMLMLDMTTCVFEIAPMSGEPPLRVLYSVVREGSLYEGALYLTAILAASAAFQQLWTLALLVIPIYVVYVAFKNAKEMHDSTFRLLESLADTVDLRDPYTGGHSRRVAEWSAQILREMNIHGPEAELILAAARVHDIGKIGVPDDILNKSDKLTPDEKRVMDRHPVLGADLLARFADFARGKNIVLAHHERWDGKGYPDGLQGWDIPFGARVIAVADSFDAMTSDRPYRNGMTTGRAIQILREGRGQQWDPTIVDAFLHCLQPSQRIEAFQTPSANLSTQRTAVHEA